MCGAPALLCGLQSGPTVIGQTLAHYRITAAIGAGGMGEVYRATDTRLRTRVALKVLPADMARDPERLERFQREARAVAALNHPHIVTIHSVEEAEGVHFLTMELVEGQPLDRVIPEGGPAASIGLLADRHRPSPMRCRPRTTRASSIATSSPPT